MSLAFRNIPLSAIAFAAAMPLALVACGDDSSSSASDNEEQPTSSAIEEEQPGSSSDETLLSSSSYGKEKKSLEGIECPAESEGRYETVVDTLIEYYDGNVMEWTSYYHCETGMWVKTECRDPLDACTADNEGEMKNVVCSQQPGNPKAAKEEWDFVCKDKKWEKMSAEESKTARINAQCTTADTKIGDVCSIVSGGNVSFGIMPNLLTCYVYTEEGWVSKASGSVSSTCEELLNAPVDSIEVPADTTEAPAASAAAED